MATAKTSVVFSTYTNGSTYHFKTGKTAIFVNFEYETDDPEQIEELRAVEKANGMIREGKREVVETPIEEQTQLATPAQQALAAATAAKGAEQAATTK